MLTWAILCSLALACCAPAPSPTDAGFEVVDLEHAAARVYDAVTVGAPLSAYASSSGGSYAASARKVRHNGAQNDGALVVDPTGAQPTWLLVHFLNQSF